MKTLTLITALGVAAGAVASTQTNKSMDIVYGEDNRLETFEADFFSQALAASTAGMVQTAETLKLKNHTILAPYTLGSSFGLCEGEKFAEQAAPMLCSGFLVGPDLLVTAGHCIQTQEDCEKVSWVFDYKVDPKTGKPPVMTSNKNVYACKKVLEAKLEVTEAGDNIDYSLVRLERKVENRVPLKFRTSGKIALGADIMVIGHPSGLPQKVAAGAKVLKNDDNNFFKTNLDTFGGNSGSAVFDEVTGIVEGILVRGAKDYERSEEGCIKVHKVGQEVTDFVRYGEAVSRITDIKTLKYRYLLMKAAKDGDTEAFISMADELEEANVYNNSMTSALHMAAENNNTEIVEYLISKGAKLDAQNEDGDTALHLAAFNNSKDSIRALVMAGASTLIENKAGLLPSQRTMYLAFKTRKALKTAQKQEFARKSRKN